MPALKLNLLGPFEACLDDQPLYSFRTNKVQALLIYLACERGHPHRREALMDLLWPEMPLESAQVNLRQTIYRLRQEIPELDRIDGDDLVPLLLSDRQTVQLNPEADVHLDIEDLQARLESSPEQVVALYRGDFLADFYLVDSNQFEQWAETVREKLRRDVLNALEKLTQSHLQDGDYDQAQTYAWQQIEIERTNEQAYRQLMTALASNGQRNAALTLFQNLEHRLQKELEIDPDTETRKLYEQIQSDEQHTTVQTQHTRAGASRNSIPVFLLTDIEGSTRLWDTYRQAMLTALLQHNAILEGQISRHGGRILEERGDGMVAVFETGNPLLAALEIQKDFAKADWGEIGAMKIRIGMHGVPSVRKDFDYFERDQMYYGSVLHHTARVMDAGWGGQILVSERVHNAFSLPQGANWVDFGFQTLKSLDEHVRIFGLIHPELPHKTFPPLRTLSNASPPQAPATTQPRHNLTPQMTTFVGRQREVRDIENLLENQNIRMVTIVGPGGMGKTRLAQAIAEDLVASRAKEQKYLFPDGVFIISLVSLSESDQIIPAITKILNIPIEVSQSTESLERASQSTTTTTQKENLIGYLYGKRVLLILDNFEHLLDGAEILADLIEAIPTIQILVTSRERLYIREEQIYPIGGLEFPDWEAPEDPEEYTAMELFLQSARRVQPDFRLEREDMIFLTRICQLVGGMPLGLELAASWVGTLPIPEIAKEIQRCIDFLETDLRNIPDRHRSLRAVFDSSWRGLSASERQVFSRLSIFRGSFTRPAAENVAQANLRTLANLVSKSLLQFDRETNRYQIHELLRQYGAEQLASDPEVDLETHHNHCAFYCAEVKNHIGLFMSGQIRHALDMLELDAANIRLAWNWAITHAQLDLIDQALNGLCIYYDWGWQSDEAVEVCQQVLDVLSKGISPEEQEALFSRRLRANTLSWLGYFNLYYKGDQAAHLLEESLTIVDQLIDQGYDARNEKCHIHYNQGLLDNYLIGDLNASKAHFQESLALSKETGFQWMTLRNLIMLGDVARNSGVPSEAKHWYSQCLAESRALGHRWGEIDSLNRLGWAARSLSSYDEAESYYQESLLLAKGSDHRWEMATSLESLGFLLIFLGKFDQSLPVFSEAVAISDELGMPYRSMPSRVHISLAHWMSGNFSKAESAILEAVSISQELNPASRIFPTICLAEFFTITGRYREATAQIRLLNTLTREVFLDRFINGRLKRVNGWLALAEKNFERARTLFAESAELYRVDSDDEQIAWSQAGLAAVAIHQARWDDAQQLLIETLWTCIEIQAFIPLLFTLPFACLYIAREDPETAESIYENICHAAFLAEAPFLHDIVYKYLPDGIVGPCDKAKQVPDDFDLRQHLWAIASGILSSWIQVWMEDSESIEI